MWKSKTKAPREKKICKGKKKDVTSRYVQSRKKGTKSGDNNRKEMGRQKKKKIDKQMKNKGEEDIPQEIMNPRTCDNEDLRRALIESQKEAKKQQAEIDSHYKRINDI